MAINAKCLEELLESRIPSLKNLHEINFKIKRARPIKRKDKNTTTLKESTTKTLMIKIITAPLTTAPSRNLQRTPLNTFRYLEKPKVLPHKKEIIAQHIVTSQSRQQFIFNNKIETEQIR